MTPRLLSELVRNGHIDAIEGKPVAGLKLTNNCAGVFAHPKSYTPSIDDNGPKPLWAIRAAQLGLLEIRLSGMMPPPT